MARDNQFITGILEGLYRGGLGNPEVQEERDRRNLEIQKTQMDMDRIAQESGMVRDIHPATKTAAQKALGIFFPGSRNLQSTYRPDPNAIRGYIGPDGEISTSPIENGVSLNPGEYKKAMIQRSNQPIYNLYNTDSSGNVIKTTSLPRGQRPGHVLKPLGQRGSTQQSNLIDSHDSVPLLFDRDQKIYIRSTDGEPVIGSAIPIKGNPDAVKATSRGLELLPKIDKLFDELNKKSGFGARASLAPVVGPVFYPEISQLINELKQIGFTFGGTNFTGTEENIIVGAMIPGPLDNWESRQNKRKALKGYISGQIDLLSAANLLGAEGKNIRDIIRKYANTPSENSNPLLDRGGIVQPGTLSPTAQRLLEKHK